MSLLLLLVLGAVPDGGVPIRVYLGEVSGIQTRGEGPATQTQLRAALLEQGFIVGEFSPQTGEPAHDVLVAGHLFVGDDVELELSAFNADSGMPPLNLVTVRGRRDELSTLRSRAVREAAENVRAAVRILQKKSRPITVALSSWGPTATCSAAATVVETDLKNRWGWSLVKGKKADLLLQGRCVAHDASEAVTVQALQPDGGVAASWAVDVRADRALIDLMHLPEAIDGDQLRLRRAVGAQ